VDELLSPGEPSTAVTGRDMNTGKRDRRATFDAVVHAVEVMKEEPVDWVACGEGSWGIIIVMIGVRSWYCCGLDGDQGVSRGGAYGCAGGNFCDFL